MKPFEFVDDLTSDVLFRAYGATLEELFENSATALFTIECDIASVKQEQQVELSFEEDTVEGLLYEWLSRLLAESEIRGLFFSGFSVKIDGTRLRARAYGSPADPALGKVHVKAVTKYKFGVTESGNGFQATVSVDV